MTMCIPMTLPIFLFAFMMFRASMAQNVSTGNSTYTIDREISTPWPIVAGHSIVTMVIALAPAFGRQKDSLTTLDTVTWTADVFRAVLAICWTIYDIIVDRHVLPSAGLASLGADLQFSSARRVSKGSSFSGHAGVVLVLALFAVYIIGGIRAWKYRFPPGSVDVIMT
jgi:hypothetical protein